MAIRTISDLHQHLQWAIEIEHGTIPPYLFALYSIKEGQNREAAEVIASVFMEEMLHLTMAANVLNAVGGSPRLDAPGVLPTYPTHLPHSARAFEIPLERLSPDSLETFLKIERPSDHQGQPEDDSYETIGQFYEAVELGIRGLCEQLGEGRVFTGDPGRQVNDRLHYRGAGRLVEVSDLHSALEALEEIIEQGEGLQHQQVWDGDQQMFHPDRAEVAHYFRFEEIRLGRRYEPWDTPRSGPSGEPLPTDWDAVHNVRPNPRSGDCPEGSEARRRMEEFNHSYSGILHLLEESFNGNPGLLEVATGQMYGLKQQAIDLMKLPSGDGTTTVGPSFEYVPARQRHRGKDAERRIVVVRDGPYLVYGDVPWCANAESSPRTAGRSPGRRPRSSRRKRATRSADVDARGRSRSATAHTPRSASTEPRPPTVHLPPTASGSTTEPVSSSGGTARSACMPVSARAGPAGSSR